jgi:hypothetical protein
MAFTEEESRQALEYVRNGAEFMFIPHANFCNLVVQDDPSIAGIATIFKIMILRKQPIVLDPKIIIKYCKKTLDRKNTFLLDNGDIKVIPNLVKNPNNKKKN